MSSGLDQQVYQVIYGGNPAPGEEIPRFASTWEGFGQLIAWCETQQLAIGCANGGVLWGQKVRWGCHLMDGGRSSGEGAASTLPEALARAVVSFAGQEDTAA